MPWIGQRAALSARRPGPCPATPPASPSTLRQAPVVMRGDHDFGGTTPASTTTCRSVGEEPSFNWMKWTFLPSRRVLTHPRARHRFSGSASEQVANVAAGLNHGSCFLTLFQAFENLLDVVRADCHVGAFLQFQQQRVLVFAAAQQCHGVLPVDGAALADQRETGGCRPCRCCRARAWSGCAPSSGRSACSTPSLHVGVAGIEHEVQAEVRQLVELQQALGARKLVGNVLEQDLHAALPRRTG